MRIRRTAAALAVVALSATACGDDGALATTAPSTTAVPTTTRPVTTTGAPTTTAFTTTTTTSAPAPTTTAAPTTTTTLPSFDGTTEPKQSPLTGDPDSRLVDVRVGSHPGFTRVVWEMDGDAGTPMYSVGYADPPFTNIGGSTVPVDGSAFLYLVFFPGMRFDISGPDPVQTYFGPETIDVGAGSVDQVVFVEDFEASMEWVIGLTGEKPFDVFTLEDPTRLVIDIAD